MDANSASRFAARARSAARAFLVETASEMLICEVKAASELDEPVVKAKAAATRVWIGAANMVAKDKSRKPWRYALIPHDAVTASATLGCLMSRYGQTPAPLGPSPKA